MALPLEAEGLPVVASSSEDRRSATTALTKADTELLIDHFLVRTENERQILFRLHLQSTVRRVSPLLLDLAASQDIALDYVLDLLRPPPNWPWRPMSDFRVRFPQGFPRRKMWLRATGSRDAWSFARSFSDPGIVLRKPNHPKGCFAIRPYRNALDFAAAIGPCILCTLGATAVLKLPDHLPETVLAAIPGRLLNDVIEHSIFARRRYRIKRVMPDAFDGLPLLIFRANLLPFEGPWAPSPSV